MICPNLTLIGLSERALLIGSKMDEFLDYIHPYNLDHLRNGKEAAIAHMIAGGDGIPYHTATMSEQFLHGCNQERVDLYQLQDWELDLSRCLADRKKGTVQ